MPLGERRRKLADERAARIKKLAEDGLDSEAIAARLGMTPNAVARIRQRLGVAAKPGPMLSWGPP